MAAISSPGIGSGIDVSGIVSKLVALERQPLQQLRSQASAFQTQLSLMGTIQSQVSVLQDAATRLAGSSAWSGVTATSSNPAAVAVSVAPGTAATSLSIEVQQLARAQSGATAVLAPGASLGAGTLHIQLGSWSGSNFTPGSPTVVDIAVIPGQDSLSAIASQINDAGAGVTATVLRDASGERLLLRSRETGEAAGFQLTVTDDDGSDGHDFTALALAPPSVGQTGQNARATLNGVSITSTSNRLSDTIAGLSLQLAQVTSAPVEVVVTPDLADVGKNIQALVDAYNALNNTIATGTRYDDTTKTAGPLQGDKTALGLQTALRALLRSASTGSPFARLSDIGVEFTKGGALGVNAEKLGQALKDLAGLKVLFTANNGNALSNGFGLKVKSFATGLLATEGLVTSRASAIKGALVRNSSDQERVHDRAARVETRLYASYNAMDAKLGKLNALNSYVTQQIRMWNGIDSG